MKAQGCDTPSKALKRLIESIVNSDSTQRTATVAPLLSLTKKEVLPHLQVVIRLEDECGKVAFEVCGEDTRRQLSLTKKVYQSCLFAAMLQPKIPAIYLEINPGVTYYFANC